MQLEVHMKALENTVLPEYHGSMLRGAIGGSIKRMSCISKDTECIRCVKSHDCPYTKIFYGINKDMNSILKKVDTTPNPFVIEPLMNGTTYIKKDDIFKFRISIFGIANSYISYFLNAIFELENRGLTKDRNKFEVEKIINTGNNLLVSEKKLLYAENIKPAIYNFEFSDEEINKLSIFFETPVRVKKDGKFIQNLDFETFITNVLRRISLILEYYSDVKMNINYKELIQEAKKICIDEINTRWVKQERYSTRRGGRLSTGGMIGKITYVGDLDEYYPYIKFGQLLHIGKGCVMGLGKYEVVVNN